MSAYRAKRLAVKFSEPPRLFLEYIDCNSSVHVRAVTLKRLPKQINLDRLTDKVIKGFPRGLDPDTVNTQQVRSLLQEVIDKCHLHQTASGPGSSFDSSSSNSNCNCLALRKNSNSNCNIRTSHTSGYDATAVTCSTSNTQATTASAQHAAYGATNLCAVAAVTASKSHSQHQLQHHEQQHTHDSSPGARQSATVTSGHSCTACCKREQQQQSADKGQLQQRQQWQLDLVQPAAGNTKGVDGWLDGCHGSSVAQQQQKLQSQNSRLGGSKNRENADTGCSTKVAQCNAVHCSVSNVTGVSNSAVAAVGSAVAAAEAAAPAPAAAASNDEFESEDSGCLTLEPDLTNGEVDLNKVSDYELRLAKSRMHGQFAQNEVKPGDAAYVYDKQVDFAPNSEANDWDEDE